MARWLYIPADLADYKPLVTIGLEYNLDSSNSGFENHGKIFDRKCPEWAIKKCINDGYYCIFVFGFNFRDHPLLFFKNKSQ